MTTCPSCGIAGNNFNCPNHIYWGINPLPDSIPMPEQSAWSSLYAEIGRLNVLLNERNKEIERLKSLMPPDERGPGFVGQGSWSVFAEKVVAERDALREVLAGLREKGIIDQHNRPLPLEGHHKDCGHGKYGWSLCTCDELKKADEERASKQFQLLVEHGGPVCKKCGDTGRATITDGVVATRGWCECSKEFKALVEEGQNLRKAFDKQTAGMRGPPRCSKCGDTGWIEYFPGSRGMKRCDEACQKTSPIDQVIDELTKVDRVTCDHGNTECKRCGVGQPTIKTPEGKPLLPPTEFSAMRIEDNRERGITECNFQRQTGRTTAMVLKALEFVKENATGAVVIEVHNQGMRKHVKELLLHYADEMGVGHRAHARILTVTPSENISGIDIGLELRDNVFDDMKENKPTRDPRQDLKVGDRVRFELKGHIEERQSAGIIQDGDGNDFEPVQYLIRDEWHRRVHIIPYNEITLVIGKVKE